MSNETKEPEMRPIGSGVFALAAGILFFIAILVRVDLTRVPPQIILKYWLFFAGAILTIWGATRITKSLMLSRDLKAGKLPKKKEKYELRWEVGQSTLNFVVGVLAATAAIVSLLVGRVGA